MQDKVKGSLHTLSMVLNGDLMDTVGHSTSSSSSSSSALGAQGGVSQTPVGTGTATEVDLFARFNRIFNRNI